MPARPVWRIERGPRHTGQCTLPGQCQWFRGAYEAYPRGYGIAQNFFEPVQFQLEPPDLGREPLRTCRRVNRFGPRFASKMSAAYSGSSFFHCPTWVGWIPYSWAISCTVLTARIASRATLALNGPLKCLHVGAFMTCSFYTAGYHLKLLSEIGVHYRRTE